MKIQNKLAWLVLACSLVYHPELLCANATLPEITIQGLDNAMADNVRSSLQIWHEQLGQEEQDELSTYFKQQIKQEVRHALEPFGYYQSDVKIDYQKIDQKWQIHIQVSLGQPVTIESIHFRLEGEGENNSALQDWTDKFPLKDGDILDHVKYEQGKKELLAPVIQAGYLNASFTTHRVEVDPQTQTAIIYLTLNTHHEYYFGPVTFEKTVLCPKFLNRYLSFETGEVYAPEKILALQTKLATSDYFSKVNVKPIIEEDNTQVPIEVELTDAKPNQYLLGIGYGTDTGVRGRAGWLRRRVNSMGHRFLAEARLSEIYTKLEADYVIPGKRPETDTIKIRGGYFEDEFSEQPSRIHEAALIEERQLGQWQRRLSFGYVEETFPAFITYDSVHARYILPNLTFTQIKRDREANPTRGRRIEINLRGSIDTLFSNTSFAQTSLLAKWLHPYSDTLKLLTRVELGATLPDDVEKVPLSQRFYAGGDLSLRGYAYRSLPLLIDKNGNYHPAGGSYLGIVSLEIVKTLKKPFGVSAFIDAGNAFRDDANEIAAGPGIGVEWQTGLGPLKVALAKPLTKNADSFRLHVIFGPEI